MALTWPWWVYSILATIVWGLHFNLAVKVSRVLPKDIYTPFTLFFITSIVLVFMLPFALNKIIANLQTVMQADSSVRNSALVMIFTALVGASLLYMAMQLSPNATIASLLDITYPIFVALTAWLLFRENHLDWSMLVGGALIFAGAALIIWKHG